MKFGLADDFKKKGLTLPGRYISESCIKIKKLT